MGVALCFFLKGIAQRFEVSEYTHESFFPYFKVDEDKQTVVGGFHCAPL